jgi:hypothetical protein
MSGRKGLSNFKLEISFKLSDNSQLVNSVLFHWLLASPGSKEREICSALLAADGQLGQGLFGELSLWSETKRDRNLKGNQQSLKRIIEKIRLNRYFCSINRKEV